MKVCVHTRVAIRRVQRHPITKKTLKKSEFIKKQVVQGTAMSLVPSAMNDIVFHHAPINIDEFIHATQDATMATVFSVAFKIVYKLLT